MYSLKKLIEIALEEDIGSGDITTDTLIDPNLNGKGIMVAKEPLVLAGLDVAREVFRTLDPEILFTSAYKDGDAVECGKTILEVEGKLRALLLGERTALNFLQHLSGIATVARAYAARLGNKNVRLVDTRKTTPGMRVIEKYAVRMGGAYNHRMGLYDGVLIKDNHIAACGGISKAVKQVRDAVSHFIKIEVEVTDLAEVREAVEAGADIIMLDNMDLTRIKEAISLVQGRALVEISGGVTINNLDQMADTGADLISSGALTHSARNVDISMRITKAD